MFSIKKSKKKRVKKNASERYSEAINNWTLEIKIKQRKERVENDIYISSLRNN